MSRGIGLVFANGSYELLRNSAPHSSPPRSSSPQYSSPHCSVGLGVARYCIARYTVAPDSNCTAVGLERVTSDFGKVRDAQPLTFPSRPFPLLGRLFRVREKERIMALASIFRGASGVQPPSFCPLFEHALPSGWASGTFLKSEVSRSNPTAVHLLSGATV